MIAQTFNDGTRDIQLIDTIDSNITSLPFKRFSGREIPFPDKSFDYTLLITVLHHSETPLELLKEAKRVTRKRIIVNEVIYMNEANRRFNIFFDWFNNRVLNENGPIAFNFNTSDGWNHVFELLNFHVVESIDIGLDQVTVPEYHWMYVLEMEAKLVKINMKNKTVDLKKDKGGKVKTVPISEFSQEDQEYIQEVLNKKRETDFFAMNYIKNTSFTRALCGTH